METWLTTLIIISFSLCALQFLFILRPAKKPLTLGLPPGPSAIPIIGTILWFLKPFSELETTLRNLRAKYGPIITVPLASRPTIFIATHSLAHQALVQNGSVFADRPPPLFTTKYLGRNQHNISSAAYGPTWRRLRRNLTSEILHPSRIKSYSHARKWVLDILINNLKNQSESGEHVRVKDHFEYAMFCLLLLMCFGDQLEEKKIKEVEEVQRRLVLSPGRFNVLNLWPSLTKIFFRKRREEFFQLREDRERVLIPLIRARKNAIKHENLIKEKDDKAGKEEFIVSYVDTLLDLQLPEENRKLEEGEIVTLCSEFLNAGTETTTNALQWILANLVKYTEIQEKLFTEIKGVVGSEEEEVVKEDYLSKIPYLKAVILEGLRRHPPGHFVLPHAVTQDTILDGTFVVPKGSIVNFMVAEMGLDPNVWEDPMMFKPERFLNSNNNDATNFDITGSREIKMMPFGVGRRICPGYGLAILHLEYFVANLIWNFKWMAVAGDDIDLSEKEERTVVMKNPLKAHIFPRMKAQNY